MDLYHEFDYLYWMFGVPKKIFCTSNQVSHLEINTEDNADILMEYKGRKPMMCNLHLDYIQYKFARSLKIVGEKGILLCDSAGHSVIRWDAKGQEKERIENPNMIPIRNILMR